MAEPKVRLRILRYRPDRDASPSFQTYEVPYNKDWVLLDAINWVKDELDQSLSYRWSCKMKVCGSCGMNVDGTPKLTCSDPLADYGPGSTITIEPLANFPIVKDLVVDIDDFIGKLEDVKAWLIPAKDKSLDQGEFLQSPEELAFYKQFTLCINCMVCYAACPVYAIDTSFIGPAAIALAYRYNNDSRDGAMAERINIIGTHEGIWACSFVGECSAVCPKHVDPAAAIQRSKVQTTMGWFQSFLPIGATK